MSKRATFSVLAVAVSTACGLPPPEPQQSLGALQQELSYITIDEAMARVTYFRPLCDAFGYPLVGNINGKIVTNTSDFCAHVRGIAR